MSRHAPTALIDVCDRLLANPTVRVRKDAARHVGDLFFEAGVAVLSGISVRNAIALIADHGSLGFKALYEKAGLPREFFRAFRVALDVLGHLRDSDQEVWSPSHVQRNPPPSTAV
jgi:Uncharacterised protein conserved in bacteria (DUF2336)